MKVLIPPIKCQGIKSKLIPWIAETIQWDSKGVWIEPFMGSGVVGFNLKPRTALFCDTNPHLIAFYQGINNKTIHPFLVREFLESEGSELVKHGADYYYEVRQRFNTEKSPLDFLFLNRACFNGLIRFNRKGKFNVPFGHKPERFSKAYVTKIVNQVAWVAKLASLSDWTFLHQDFQITLSRANEADFIYCDPPYAGRHTDYFNTWGETQEKSLYEGLKEAQARFILSTWHSNEHRNNPAISTLWSEFNVITREHFYHLGAKESNRKPMLEALVTNFEPAPKPRKTASECETYAADALQLKLLQQKGQSRYTPRDSFSEKTELNRKN
ncbi:MAG: Dam family site-specific DNA-(adenine-N6)-methyltransferase [Candidatus Poribacteria bacterium]|nr:Dam family site-specific DNA-(adenine-N6)-methyltransferase [Candidatus Poribacteria bacterium]